MSTTTENVVFIITNTAGTPIAAIQPATLNGPGGVQTSSDLSLFGIGYPTWGQASDQNDYRLLEHFACPETSPGSGIPQSATTLGDGNGINTPIIGMLWFNTSQSKMFMYTSSGWALVAGGATVPTVQPTPPSTGELWYNTAIPQLEVYNGSAWASVAARYLPLSGGTLTGDLNMSSNTLTAAAVNTQAVNATYYRASNGAAGNQITIPTDGATTITDGPRIGPYVIIHTGNAAALNSFTIGMIMMWYGSSSSPPTGWSFCNGTNGTPDLRDKFVIGAGLTYSKGQTGGSLTPAVNITAATIAATTSGSTTLTISQMPAHSHSILYAYGTQPGGGGGGHYTDLTGLTPETTIQQGASAGQQIIGNTGGGTGHTHTVPASTHTHTASISSSLPPYYGLFYIMYTG